MLYDSLITPNTNKITDKTIAKSIKPTKIETTQAKTSFVLLKPLCKLLKKPVKPFHVPTQTSPARGNHCGNVTIVSQFDVIKEIVKKPVKTVRKHTKELFFIRCIRDFFSSSLSSFIFSFFSSAVIVACVAAFR